MDNKYVKIFRENKQPIKDNLMYECTEKLDGANFSFFVKSDGDLIFRSRNRVIEGEDKQFNRAMLYIREVHSKIPFERMLIYFGECMSKHTIFYGDSPSFIGFAVYDPIVEVYLHAWQKYYNERNIITPTVTYITGAQVKEYINKHLNDKSEFGTTGAIREGLVFKNYDFQEFVKFVREQFKEDNRKVFGGGFVPECDTGKIVARFCTHGRIEKTVFKIRDEYNMDVGIEMMSKLPKMVCDDIILEEFQIIYSKYGMMDFKKFRKLVAKECVRYFS